DPQREPLVLGEDLPDLVPALLHGVLARGGPVGAGVGPVGVVAVQGRGAVGAPLAAGQAEAADPGLQVSGQLLAPVEGVPQGHYHETEQYRRPPPAATRLPPAPGPAGGEALPAARASP